MLVRPQEIDINEYNYDLPEERIAKFPLEQRDASKLLIYKNGHLSHGVFRELPGLLPEQALLVFNNTRVIHARLHFTLPNGKPLEILCLEPLSPAEHQQSFSSTQAVHWKCMVGGNRRWKSGEIAKTVEGPSGEVNLSATRIGRTADAFEIRFEWDDPTLAFGELLAAAGIIPLPPYLNRENTPEDEDRYQTVYAEEEGSVAAPTAGLHFTDEVLRGLEQQGAQRAFVTLHVGAGTFKPVTADRLEGHHMHEESIFIHPDTLQQLAAHLEAGHPVIPVGTTSTRLLESLYWHGRKVLDGGAAPFASVGQWEPYEGKPDVAPAEALRATVEHLKVNGQEHLQGFTRLIIAPGYTFRICSGMITNFHQPRSTLLLLIAALIGKDWKAAYQYALDNSFRFLSYGDSSLLLGQGVR